MAAFLVSPLWANESLPEKLVSVNAPMLGVQLSTRVGGVFDPSAIERDVRALYASGRVADVRARSWHERDGWHVRFDVVPLPRRTLRELKVVPPDAVPAPKVPKGEPMDARLAHLVAQDLRRRLELDGRRDVRVRPQLKPVASSQVDLELHVSGLDRTRVGNVVVEGDVDDIGAAALRPWQPRWFRRLPLSPQSKEAARTRLVSAFIAAGYVDAVVFAETRARADEVDAELRFIIHPGVRTGNVPSDLCRCAWKMREQARRVGVLDFAARWVDGSLREESGKAFVIRRIEFSGNRTFSDSTIRRNLLVEEGNPLDSDLLRRSLDRLNRSGMFQPLSEADVDIRTDEIGGLADVRIRLKERKAGSWLFSGPAGPISLAGPFRFSLSSRLPAWGQGILDLASLYGSVHLGPEGVIASLDRPFTPSSGWLSGFSVAPQLGWRAMAVQYGATQARERLFSVVAGDSQRGESLLVSVARQTGEDATVVCEAPGERWRWLRRGASVALQFGSFLL